MTMTLGADHRLIDGAMAAKFLGKLKNSGGPATLA